MSGFVAALTVAGPELADVDVGRMIAALKRRGELTEVWRDKSALLAVTRFDWELADGYSGSALVAHDHELVIAADATLYYRDDLARKLRDAGVTPAGSSVAHLIGAAYRAWGVDCPRQLEGDYAFVVHDRATHRTFAARDFMGRRPLYYARIGTSLVIASSVAAILEHPSCPRDLDPVALAEIVGVSLAGHNRTPYRAVEALPAASSLEWDGAGTPDVRAHWEFPVDDDVATQSFDDAVEELRALLGSAIVERRAPDGQTAIWLSGGYDSPVMYGVGNDALDRRGFDRLRPVSVSYPPNDPAREDELIEEITRFWNTTPSWLSIDDAPLLANASQYAAVGDIPFQHAFENWLRSLFGAARAQGSRVVLYGDGGDQLFAVSTVFLRDLFSGLRWRELRREWRAFGGRGARALWRSIVRPALIDGLNEFRRNEHPEFSLPAWIHPEFVHRHQLETRQLHAEAILAKGDGGRAGTETRRSLGNPIIPRVLAGLSAMALEHSVELRAPLLDRRIVDFALRRPRAERASAGAVKHLLRQAGAGRLPPSVLAPRPTKTGVLTKYFADGFRVDPSGLVSDVFANPILAGLGVVDAASLQQAWRDYQRGAVGSGGVLIRCFPDGALAALKEPRPASLTARLLTNRSDRQRPENCSELSICRRPTHLPGNPGKPARGGSMYEAPKLERLGTFREVTLAGGAVLAADGANPFHRYTAI